MRLARTLLGLGLALGMGACESDGRFRLSWEIRVGSAVGAPTTCDPETQIEVESRVEQSGEIFRDRFPCAAMEGTTRPLPSDEDLIVTIRYQGPSGVLIAATAPTRERAVADKVSDLGKVVIVKPEPAEELVVNLHWGRANAGDDGCVPQTSSASRLVKRMAYSLVNDRGEKVAGSAELSGDCPELGGATCANVINFPVFAHGSYELEITGLDDGCATCWPIQRIPITHSGGVVEAFISAASTCQ